MAFIRRLRVHGLVGRGPLVIDLPSGDTPRHLMVTGPNGSGKTTLLEGIAEHIGAVRRGAPPRSRLHLQMHVELDGEQHLRPMYFPVRRDAELTNVSSPTNEQPALVSGAMSTPTLLQFLVNKKTEQAFAAAEGDQAAVHRIEEYFADVLTKLRDLFGEPELEWSFDRKTYRFTLRHGSGFEHDLTRLADGHAAALAILGDLLLREEATSGARPTTIAVIDEIEAHLHVGLQERILPLLSAFFPTTQFVIATHSPAVISSVPNAFVVDLGSGKQFKSEELQGVPYGTLMTSYFGIQDEFDLDSSQKLARLKELARIGAERGEIDALADELRRRSSTLALRVWEILDGPEPQGARP